MDFMEMQMTPLPAPAPLAPLTYLPTPKDAEASYKRAVTGLAMSIRLGAQPIDAIDEYIPAFIAYEGVSDLNIAEEFCQAVAASLVDPQFNWNAVMPAFIRRAVWQSVRCAVENEMEAIEDDERAERRALARRQFMTADHRAAYHAGVSATAAL